MHPSRLPIIARSVVATLAAGLALGACSDSSTPLAPAPAPAAPSELRGIAGGLMGTVGDVVPGTVGGLALTKPLPGVSYAALKNDVASLSRAVQHGLASAPALACKTEMPLSQTQQVGREGGVITVGAHRLEIPAGALDTNVTITASVPAGASLGIQFKPHGLRFYKPVEISLDYAGCAIPSGAYLNVVYTETGARPTLDGMPSHDQPREHRISALTDHFSGYIVAWGRQK